MGIRSGVRSTLPENSAYSARRQHGKYSHTPDDIVASRSAITRYAHSHAIGTTTRVDCHAEPAQAGTPSTFLSRCDAYRFREVAARESRLNLADRSSLL